MDALQPDENQGAVERDRVRTEPAAGGDRPAVRPQHRRGLDIGKGGHLAAGIDDAASEPASLVAKGDEAFALGIEPYSRKPTETAKARGQHQPAAVFERPQAQLPMVTGS